MPSPIPRRLMEAGYLGLFALMLGWIALEPLLGRSRLGHLAFLLLFVAILALGLALSQPAGTLRRSVLGGGLVLLAVLWGVHALHPLAGLLAVVAGLVLLYVLYVPARLLLHVLRARRVTGDVLFASLCAYLFFGFGWGILYGLLHAMDPGAFHLPGAFAGAGSPFLYFSFVTLTTLGYGDITPASETARAMALLEALVGQIYLVVVVARLVALHIAHEDRSSSP